MRDNCGLGKQQPKYDLVLEFPGLVEYATRLFRLASGKI